MDRLTSIFSRHIFSKNGIDKTRGKLKCFGKNRVRKIVLDIRKDSPEASCEEPRGTTAFDRSSSN